MAESQGFDWDPALWPMVLASNGGVLPAARSALADGVAGSLSSGLHHARYDEGSGFCTFNGLVIAAKALLASGAVSSVLIVDLDAHCGGGTAQLIDGDTRIWHADVAVSSFDSYVGRTNSQLHDVVGAADYLPAVRQSLAHAERIGPFDLCLYNAGMDPYQGCAIGGLDGITGDVLGADVGVRHLHLVQLHPPPAFGLGAEPGVHQRDARQRLAGGRHVHACQSLRHGDRVFDLAHRRVEDRGATIFRNRAARFSADSLSMITRLMSVVRMSRRARTSRSLSL